MRLGERALGDQARDEGIPARGVERPVRVLGGPLPAEQELALVGVVAGVQDRVQHLGHADAVVPAPEGVVELGCGDEGLGHRGLDHIDQCLELAPIDQTVGAVAVGGDLDGLEDEPQERTAEGAVLCLGPLLDAAQDRRGLLQPVPFADLGIGQRTLLAGQHVGDPDVLHPSVKLIGQILEIQQIAVDLHLPGALGQMPEGLQLVGEPPHLLHRELAEGLRVGQRGVHAGGDHGVHRRIVLLHELEVLHRPLARARRDAVDAQDRAHGVHHVGVTAALDQFLVVALGDLAEELDRSAHLGLRIEQCAHGLVVQELVFLRLHGSLCVALLRGRLPGSAGTGLGGTVQVDRILQLAHRAPGCEVCAKCPRGLDQGVHGDRATAGIGATRGLAGVHRLVLGLQFCGQCPCSCLVVHGLVGGSLQRLLRGHVTVALQHAPIDLGLDRLVHRAERRDGGRHLLDRGVARGIRDRGDLGIALCAVFVPHLADRARSDHLGLGLELPHHLGQHALAQLARLLGELLQELGAGVQGPLQRAHAALLQALKGFVCGIKLGQQACLLLGLRDLLVGREHAVEDLADLVIDLEVAPAHEVRKGLVDVHQPGAEPAEQGLELGAGGFPFQQVLLEGLCPLLVVLALLV